MNLFEVIPDVSFKLIIIKISIKKIELKLSYVRQDILISF